MYVKLGRNIREIILILCKYKNLQIIDGAVCKGHAHLSVAIPLKLSIRSYMRYLKSKSPLMIYDILPELQIKWVKVFWERGYYVWTIGNITEDAIRKYIQEQSEESRKEKLEVHLFRGLVTELTISAFQECTQSAIIRMVLYNKN